VERGGGGGGRHTHERDLPGRKTMGESLPCGAGGGGRGRRGGICKIHGVAALRYDSRGFYGAELSAGRVSLIKGETSAGDHSRARAQPRNA